MRLVDIPAARTWHPHVPASTIRRWAHEGRLPQRGTDRKGRRLYDLDDLDRLVATHRRQRAA